MRFPQVDPKGVAWTWRLCARKTCVLKLRATGVMEILGVVGLILPPLTGVAPVLALVAAIGFVVLQVLATGLHLSRGEVKETGLNITLIAMAAVAAWLTTTWLG